MISRILSGCQHLPAQDITRSIATVCESENARSTLTGSFAIDRLDKHEQTVPHKWAVDGDVESQKALVVTDKDVGSTQPIKKGLEVLIKGMIFMLEAEVRVSVILCVSPV